MAPTLGLAVALLVLGVIGLLFFPWGGIVLALVGIVLLVAYLIGFGRRAVEPGP